MLLASLLFYGVLGVRKFKIDGVNFVFRADLELNKTVYVVFSVEVKPDSE